MNSDSRKRSKRVLVAVAAVAAYLEDRTRMLSTVIDPTYIDLYCSYHGRYLCGNYWHPPAGFDVHVRPWYLRRLRRHRRDSAGNGTHPRRTSGGHRRQLKI